MAAGMHSGGARHRPRQRQATSASRSHRHSTVRYQAGHGGTEVNCCVKYSIFTFNVFFFILGFALLGVGVWAQLEKTSLFSQLSQASGTFGSSLYLDPSIVLIVVGLVTFVIGFTGCVGSLRENTTLLTFYATLLGLLLLVECALAVYLYVAKDDFYNIVTNLLDKMIERYRDDPDLQTIIDSVQSDWGCCGVTNPNDWDRNVYFAQSASSFSSPEAGGVPFSCCTREYRFSSDGLTNLACGQMTRLRGEEYLKRIHVEGCMTRIQELVNKNVLYVGVATIAIAVVQMLGICFAQNLKSDILAQKAKWLNS